MGPRDRTTSVVAGSLAVLVLPACVACPKPGAPAPATHAKAATGAPSAAARPEPVASTRAESDGDGDGDEGAVDAANEDDEELREDPPNPALEAEWTWIQARFPDVTKYQRLDTTLLARLLEWAKPGETIAVFDRACGSAHVRRAGASLYGSVHRGFQLAPGHPDEMSEARTEYRIGWSFDEFPSNWTNYKRDNTGTWRVEGSGGFGDGRVVGRMLSAVTTDAAWFDNAAIAVNIACNHLAEEESRCTGGGKRTCSRCQGWGPFPRSRQFPFGIHRQPKKQRVKASAAADCSAPCPPIDEPSDVTRANAALRQLEFVYPVDSEPKPAIFRTEAACREYTKKHPFEAGDLLLWQGDKYE